MVVWGSRISLICLRIPKKRQWNVRKRDFVDVALSEAVGSELVGWEMRVENGKENWKILGKVDVFALKILGDAQPAMVLYWRCLLVGKVEGFEFHFDTVDGSEIRLTSWGWYFFPLFTRFYTYQVVSRISEPSTVSQHFFLKRASRKRLKKILDASSVSFTFGSWHISGQIIATSHDLGPQEVAFWKENPRLFQGNLGEGDILFHLARYLAACEFPVKPTNVPKLLVWKPAVFSMPMGG